MSCAVKNYKNAKIFRPEGIHFHRFPKGQLLHLWKSALGLDENWQRSANKYVCGLNIPSDGVVKIYNTAEIFIKRMLLITDKRMPSENTFILAIAQQYYDKIDLLFPSFKDHIFATAIVEENHGYALIKAIVAAYSQIRLFN
ncbi:hypothetical protein NQ317_004243 [Molorchus minor]|uniref:Uncharacterized protein n=1 Tax=Molorchus minor TaxID=1323400 RepID=A0ABQ9JZ23_9CUCU|nr:hypothetical protein NQ317_004243 [Molorchus minor]